MSGNKEFSVEDLLIGIIRIFAVIILAYLFFLTVFTTSPLKSENVPLPEDGITIFGIDPVQVADSPMIHAMVIGAFVVILFLISRKMIKVPNVSALKKWHLYVLFFVVGVIYLVTLNSHPISDPLKVLNIAEQILQGDYSTFTEVDGYMHRYPFQNAIVLLDMGLVKVFGEHAFFAYQLINLFSQLVFIGFMGKSLELAWGRDSRIVGLSKMMIILFPVFFLYITYNYGNVISMALIMVSIYFEQLYFRNHMIRNLLCGSIFAALACVMKSNSRIIVIAMIICLLLDFIKSRNKYNILFIVLLVVLRMAAFAAVNNSMEAITGIDTPKGMPMINWVCIGISGDGPYNGVSVSIYEDAGYDYDKSVEYAKEFIKLRMHKMMDRKSELIRWFGRKMAVAWSNPTFDSFELSSHDDSRVLGAFYTSLVEGNIRTILEKYLNLFQSVILFLTLLFVISTKKIDTEKIVMILATLGGFAFHIIWESGAHYVLPYFMFLFPYAANGICLIVDSFREKNFRVFRNIAVILAIGVCIYQLKDIRIVGLAFFAS